MRIKKIVFILSIMGAIYFLILSPHGLVKIIQLKWQIHRTQEEIKVLQAKEVALKHEIKLLESDTAYIHKAAREKFGIR